MGTAIDEKRLKLNTVGQVVPQGLLLQTVLHLQIVMPKVTLQFEARLEGFLLCLFERCLLLWLVVKRPL